MKKLIISGANGVGKSHLARRLKDARPDVPVISYDALRLTTAWQKRPAAEVKAALKAEISKDAWILEGGPSLLPLALDHADGLVWIDPPEALRALRLLVRPWKSLGQTRPELPKGNVDWPIQQYRFAWRSLRKRAKFKSYLRTAFASVTLEQKWHCRSTSDLDAVIARWASFAS
jgi:adenylate kinase family enzyme